MVARGRSDAEVRLRRIAARSDARISEVDDEKRNRPSTRPASAAPQRRARRRTSPSSTARPSTLPPSRRPAPAASTPKSTSDPGGSACGSPGPARRQLGEPAAGSRPLYRIASAQSAGVQQHALESTHDGPRTRREGCDRASRRARTAPAAPPITMSTLVAQPHRYTNPRTRSREAMLPRSVPSTTIEKAIAPSTNPRRARVGSTLWSGRRSGPRITSSMSRSRYHCGVGDRLRSSHRAGRNVRRRGHPPRGNHRSPDADHQEHVMRAS